MARNIDGLKRGGPGRPKGSKNKATLIGQEFAREFIEDPQGVEAMRQLYREGKLPPGVWVHIASLAWGKPKDVVEIQTPVSLEIPILYTRDDIMAAKDEDSGGDDDDSEGEA